MTDRKAPRGGRKSASGGRTSYGKKDSSDSKKRSYSKAKSDTGGADKPWKVASDGDDKPRRSSSKESSYGDKPKRSYAKRDSDFGDKPYKKRDSFKSSDSDDKPKRSYGDRPKRNYGDDKPKRSYGGGDDKPRRSSSSDSSYGDRPKRSYGDDKPKRSYGSGDDRPRRSSSESSYGDKPKRSYGSKDSSYGDRPKRSYGDDKPKRSYGSGDDRPRRSSSESSYGDKPKRNYGSKDSSYGDKPYKKHDSYNSDDKPKRSYVKRDNDFGDKPKRSYGSKESSYGDKPKRSYVKKDNDFGDKPYKKRDSFSSFNSDDKPKRSYGSKETSYGDKPKRSYTKRDSDSGDKPYKKRDSFDTDDRPKRSYSGDEVGFDTFKRKPATPSYISSYEPEDSRERKNRTKTASARQSETPKLTAETRLNKFIANSGVCSRREADTFIKAGLVTVNGEVVMELGVKVLPSDEVKFNGELLRGEKKTYLIMNKPKGYVTTVEDPHADKTVMEIVENYCNSRVYPVGRLDKNSTGILLFTNDGELTLQLTHPSYNKKKIYQVDIDKALTKNDMQRLTEGVELEDGLSYFDVVEYLNEEKTQFGIEIHSGRNRIIRRMFEHLGYRVTKLDRVYFAGLTKKNLKRGECRFLSDKEVSVLKMGSYE